jgi:hypothetical protein
MFWLWLKAIIRQCKNAYKKISCTQHDKRLLRILLCIFGCLWGSGCITPVILNLDTKWRSVLNSSFELFIRSERAPAICWTDGWAEPINGVNAWWDHKDYAVLAHLHAHIRLSPTAKPVSCKDYAVLAHLYAHIALGLSDWVTHKFP